MKKTLLLAGLLIILAGCINPLGAKKTETETSKASERISTQQAITMEKMVTVEPPPSVEVLIPVNQLQASSPTVSTKGKTNVFSHQAGLMATNPRSAGSLSAVYGDNIVVRIPARSETRVKTEATGDIAAMGNTSSQYSLLKDISLGGKMILFGTGLILILLAVWLVRKQYKAADVFISKIDSAVAIGESKFSARINMLKERALSSTDPVENSKISAEIAHLNEERGKFKSEVNALKSP